MIKIEFPLETVSESNIREHWAVTEKRHKIQKWAVKSELSQVLYDIPMPCCIEITRISPRLLDDDNLRGAMKTIRDAIADFIYPGMQPGRADSMPGLKWSYSQEKGKVQGMKGIRITFSKSP